MQYATKPLVVYKYSTGETNEHINVFRVWIKADVNVLYCEHRTRFVYQIFIDFYN